MKITRRGFVSGGFALAGFGPAPAVAGDAPSLAANVGEILMLGFTGNNASSQSAKVLAEHIAARRVGAVVFRKLNVGTRAELADLVAMFSPRGAKPLLALDHEGGAVQRLVGAGYTRLPPALAVARDDTPKQAKALYAKAAVEFAAAGFNLNLAPVVDLHDPDNPAIGRFGRAFDRDAGVVAAYSQAFVEAFAAAGVHCVLKHFPGEGMAHEDSHQVLPDVTARWSADELVPYVSLIASGNAPAIMGANVRLNTFEPAPIPVTLSRAIMTDLLRGELNFQGVAMTDDLDMDSVSKAIPRRDAVIRAIAAGNDLLMVCNTKDFDPELPQHAVEWVAAAITGGVLTEARVAEAAGRVRALRHSPT